ncbi:hypothetical protein TPHA_0J01890 [Tetrapisispora phaffii CBS 4417]|uniref:CDC20/Fizzy WD40 domain-containing protein n=1 Tax=Tetrapisispora phaffii (strain ATCC 24235 / CBS 4417 / NBRC 1672 / NRRL Y-8282 / UCD 70-5) TaxID=1071381 RepID=G8BYR8_TETPH|nr:hypothetical protein TPHA_0J01890 [Tetrapisispora phaffii CBS 4417]CCE65010.1 hypothetical protein TPHA_0J01890 [Tetrapisispora phaffii CBS 4417]
MELSNSEKLAFTANRSVLSLTSPTKLNIITGNGANKSQGLKRNSLRRTTSLNIRGSSAVNSVVKPDFNVPFRRQKISSHKLPLLNRSSSFFKERSGIEHSNKTDSMGDNAMKDSAGSNLMNKSTGTTPFERPSLTRTSSNIVFSLNRPALTKQESIDDLNDPYFYQTDRFIPLMKSNSQNKIDPIAGNDDLPPPNASPKAHLKAQTKIAFKETVAEACGFGAKQRILQYMPKAPVSSLTRKSYSLQNRTHYSYSSFTSSSQSNTKSHKDLMRLRKINTNPEKILDAPGFIDDFYLNLLTWSKKNILAIALSNTLYLWNGNSGDVSLLVEYDATNITSITWSDDQCHLSIGKDDGNTEIWDTETSTLVRTMRSNLGVRIGSQSWLNTLLATGSRSGEIQINDVRIKNHVVSTWEEHSGEVCGLEYKSDGLQLASGGNDNAVIIWDTRTSMPQFIKHNHNAAVKAIKWSPNIANLLATGGGQSDQYVHFWNTTTGNKTGSINTGSQVSSLHWGQSYNSSYASPYQSSNIHNDIKSDCYKFNNTLNREIVTTGGNPGNAISVFNFDTKYKVAEIENAHESRICCSQLSPDGTTLATVGGDENLKFYKIFDSKRKNIRRNKSVVDTEDILGLFTHNNDENNNHTQDHENTNLNNANNDTDKNIDNDQEVDYEDDTNLRTTRVTSRKTTDYLIR